MNSAEKQRFALIVPGLNPLLRSCVLRSEAPMLPKFGVLATTKGKKTLKISKAAMKELRSASASKDLCLKTCIPKSKSREKKAIAKKEAKVQKGFDAIHKKFDAVNVEKANETVENKKKIAELRAQSAALSQDVAVLKDQLSNFSSKDHSSELKTSLELIKLHSNSLSASVEELRKSKAVLEAKISQQTSKEDTIKVEIQSAEVQKRTLQESIEALEKALAPTAVGPMVSSLQAHFKSSLIVENNKENQSSAANTDAASLLFGIWTAERELSQQAEAAQKLKERWVAAEKLREELRLKVSIAKDSATEVQSNNKRIQKELEHDDDKISGLSFDIKTKSKQLDEEMREQQATKSLVEKSRIEALELERTTNHLLDETERLRREIAHLNSDMSKNTQRITTSWKCIDQHKDQKTQAEIKVQKLKKTSTDLSKTQVDLLVDLKVLRNSLLL